MSNSPEDQNLVTDGPKISSRKVLHHEPRHDKSRRAVTICKSIEEVYSFWRDFKNFPFFMKDIERVDVFPNGRSHWVLKLQSGLIAEWDVRITEERPQAVISWESLPDSEVKTSGSVWFHEAPAGRGTIVCLSMNYSVPGGKLVELATMLKGEDPDTLALFNLRRVKAYLETGVIATTEGQPSGRDEDLDKSKH